MKTININGEDYIKATDVPQIKPNGNRAVVVVDRYQLEYTEAKKLTRMFNESAWIRRLPPMRDAVKYVHKLHEEHGYVFHVISSLSDDTYSQYLRTRNLIELFGPTVFEKYTYLDTGADKDDALEPYRDSDCWWIEDKPANAALGAGLGLKALLMQHHHNIGWNARQYDVTRVMNWREVYEMIIGEGQR